MSRSRRQTDDSSLDLLLDTICNVFGGVVFIAILIAILTSNTTGDVDETAKEQVEKMVERYRSASLGFRIQQTEEAIERLKITRDLISNEESRRGIAFIDSLETSSREADERILRLQDWLQSNVRMQRAEDTLAQAGIAEVEAQINELKRKLEQQRAVDTVHIRLPIERRTEKKQILLLLQNNRVYVVPLGNALPLLDRVYNFRDVSVDEILGGWRVHPAIGGGFMADANGMASPRAQTLFGAARPDEYYFHLFVASDSVEAFRGFRDVAVKRGYRYNIAPIGQPPLTLSPSGTKTVQ